MTISYWKPGTPVVYRGVWRRKLWWATVVTVVQDDPELTVLYWPAGTPEKLPAERLSPRDLLSREQVELVDRPASAARVTPPRLGPAESRMSSSCTPVEVRGDC